MTFNLIVSLPAETDIEEIIEWYGNENKDLSREFVRILEQTFEQVTANPFLFQQVFEDYRIVNTAKFPYKIIYRISENKVIVLAVIHHKRNPAGTSVCWREVSHSCQLFGSVPLPIYQLSLKNIPLHCNTFPVTLSVKAGTMLVRVNPLVFMNSKTSGNNQF